MKAVMVSASMVGLFLSLANFGVIGAEGRSVQSGVYTAEQAKRGEKVWEDECLECHSPDEFVGGWMDGWSKQMVFDLYNNINETMPENNPGGLGKQESADMIAYIFQSNNLPTGEEEMRFEDLKEILIEGPFGKE